MACKIVAELSFQPAGAFGSAYATHSERVGRHLSKAADYYCPYCALLDDWKLQKATRLFGFVGLRHPKRGYS